MNISKKYRNLFFTVSVILVLFSFIEKKSTNIYMIGDSTMASYKEDRAPLTGWGQVMSDYFKKPIRVDNHATSGRSTKSFISEGRWDKVFENLQPDNYVFIQFGHNDAKKDDPRRYADPNGLYKENLIKFVKETRDKGAIPILLTPIARRAFNDDGSIKNTHGDYLKAVNDVSKSLDVIMIDMFKLTSEYVAKLGPDKSKDVYLWVEPNEIYPEGKEDNTHLSTLGAHQFAKLVLREVINQDIPLKSQIRKKMLDSPGR
ncbi:MAG: rhamnogalacturonan acetylesterase [Cyclobacteriaceae bacterium]|nr:rhamnogalacturonan acetylesterase [Cyclobacteriaceae bacterium SS2]